MRLHLFNNKLSFWIFFLLVLYRIVYVFLPANVAWDASVYIGMGEYMHSFGRYGIWELFRPPALPILFSIGSFFGIPLLWAKFLTFVASISALLLTYKIGEEMHKNAGIFAMYAMGISTVFFSFTNTPMTEIFGVTFSLATLYVFLIKKNYFYSGLLVGLCLITRFPYGLLTVILGSSLFVFNWKDKTLWKLFIKNAVNFSIGFFIIALPYLLSNYILYGNALLPFIVGKEMIGGFMWLYSGSLLFYPTILFWMNPLFLLTSVYILIFLFKQEHGFKKTHFYTLIIWIGMFFIYFTQEPNKQIRYIIPVLPALALTSGVAMGYIYTRVKPLFFFLVLGILSVITISNTQFFITPPKVSKEFKEFYSVLKNEKGKKVIASSPMLVVYSPVIIIEAFNSWSQFNITYMENRGKADYILIDSCELYVCKPSTEADCAIEKENVLKKVFEREDIIYNNTSAGCIHIISKIKK